MYSGQETEPATCGAQPDQNPRGFNRDARLKQEEARLWEAHNQHNIVNQAIQGGPASNLAIPIPQSPNLDNIEELMKYQPWGYEQQQAGDIVREALTAAAKAILRAVPPSHYRDEAVRDIINARMRANAGISFRGRF